MNPWGDDSLPSTQEIFGFSDEELDARAAWSLAKLRIVAGRHGINEVTLAQRMDFMPDEERLAMLSEMDRAVVDPRTGSGLH